MSSVLKNEILENLKNVVDPELHVNVVDLGLIYNVETDEDEHKVKIEMTFTTPFCPYGGMLQKMVKESVESLDNVSGCEVSVTFDPPWDKDKMTDEAKLNLGLI